MFHNWGIAMTGGDNQLQTVLQTKFFEFSLLFGHYPRIPDDMRNVTNVGNLVSIYMQHTHVMMVMFIN